MKSRSRGVLDTRFRGYDEDGRRFAPSCWLAMTVGATDIHAILCSDQLLTFPSHDAISTPPGIASGLLAFELESRI
jgi:hypothetical protein